MKAYDFEACIYNGDVFCVDCLPRGLANDDYTPIFALDEWTYVPVCERCGTHHEYISLIEENF